MKKILVLILISLMLSCSPRTFKTPVELIEKAKEKHKKEHRLKEDWKAIALFTFFVFGIYQLKK